MLVLSAYVFARDHGGLISHSSKVLGVVAACFAFVGMCTVGSWVPWVSTVTVLISLAAAIVSGTQAAVCFRVRDSVQRRSWYVLRANGELDCHGRYLDM